MTIRMAIILSGTFIAVTRASCQDANQQTVSALKLDLKQGKPVPFIKQVTLLDEFKQAQKQVDSIKKASGIPLEVSIDVINDSYLKEDAGKNLSIAYINQKSQYDIRILYTVKFDKGSQKIISVVKNKRRSDKTSLPVTTDTIPKKN